MEKVIMMLKLNNEGKVIVYNNEEEVLSIDAETKMQIKASEIFESLKYNIDNTYVLDELPGVADESLRRKYEAMTKLHNFYGELIAAINEIGEDDELTEDICLPEEDF